MSKLFYKHIKLIFITLALILLTPNLSAQQTDTNKIKWSSLFNIFKSKSKDNQADEVSAKKVKAINPTIKFDKLFFDYGDVVQGEEATAEFEISNTGNGLLQITDIEISCNCIDVILPSKTIKPKTKIKLQLKYNTNIVGEIKKSITIVCNDKRNSRTTLLLTGNVILKNKKY